METFTATASCVKCSPPQDFKAESKLSQTDAKFAAAQKLREHYTQEHKDD